MDTTIKPSKSVRIALGFLIEILAGKVVNLPQPTWYRFNFFYKIVATKPTRKKCKLRGQPYLLLTRRVQFYGRDDRLIATFGLEGGKFTAIKTTSISWRVVDVWYRTKYDDITIEDHLVDYFFESPISEEQSPMR